MHAAKAVLQTRQDESSLTAGDFFMHPTHENEVMGAAFTVCFASAGSGVRQGAVLLGPRGLEQGRSADCQRHSWYYSRLTILCCSPRRAPPPPVRAPVSPPLLTVCTCRNTVGRRDEPAHITTTPDVSASKRYYIQSSDSLSVASIRVIYQKSKNR